MGTKEARTRTSSDYDHQAFLLVDGSSYYPNDHD